MYNTVAITDNNKYILPSNTIYKSNHKPNELPPGYYLNSCSKRKHNNMQFCKSDTVKEQYPKKCCKSNQS